MLWGPPGVGKTDLLMQVAKTLNYKLIIVHGLTQDAVDVHGFPVVREVDGALVTLFSRPGFFPTENKVLIFLDEFCSAPGMIQTAFSQLLLHGRIGEHILPDQTQVALASNRMSDRAIVHSLPTPLANRMVHIDYEVDLDDWTKWAFAADVKEEVIAYVRFAPGALHEFDPHDKGTAKKMQERTGEHAFPSPRSYEFVSDILKTNPDPRVEKDLIIGTIGKGRGTELIAFLKMFRDAPSLDAILLDPKRAKVPEKLDIKYAVAIGLSRKMDPKNVRQAMVYLERLPRDMNVMSVKGAVDRDPQIGKTKDFVEWSIQNHDNLFTAEMK